MALVNDKSSSAWVLLDAEILVGKTLKKFHCDITEIHFVGKLMIIWTFL